MGLRKHLPAILLPFVGIAGLFALWALSSGFSCGSKVEENTPCNA